MNPRVALLLGVVLALLLEGCVDNAAADNAAADNATAQGNLCEKTEDDGGCVDQRCDKGGVL